MSLSASRPIRLSEEKLRRQKKTHNVFKGIITGFIGLIIWVLFSIPLGIDAAIGTPVDPTFEALMVGGPVVYIVILPILGWWRKKRSSKNLGEMDG